jgi:hypothetical protein
VPTRIPAFNNGVVHFFEQYQKISDSIFSSTLSNSIAETQKKYEIVKRDREIQNLSFEKRVRHDSILTLNYKNQIFSLKLKKSEFDNEKKSHLLALAASEQQKQDAEIDFLNALRKS